MHLGLWNLKGLSSQLWKLVLFGRKSCIPRTYCVGVSEVIKAFLRNAFNMLLMSHWDSYFSKLSWEDVTISIYTSKSRMECAVEVLRELHHRVRNLIFISLFLCQTQLPPFRSKWTRLYNNELVKSWGSFDESEV